jgi:hypothetical protein
MWTGRLTLNQIWTYVRVSEPILVDEISIHWGGYDASTRGRHFIAKVDPSNHARLIGLVAISDWITVPQGRRWHSTTIKEKFIEPGHYAVGIFGDNRSRRIMSEWNGAFENKIFVLTTNTFDPTSTGRQWKSSPEGALPVKLTYETAGRVKVNVNGSWKTGSVYVNVNGSWKKAKTVWTNVNGTWKRGE